MNTYKMVIDNSESEIEDDADEEKEDEGEELGYNSKSEFSKAAVALRAFEAVREARAEEMIRGGTNSVFDKNGNVVQVHFRDTRAKFIASMIALDATLEPDADKKYLDAREKFEAEREQAFDIFAIQQSKVVYNPDGITTKKVFIGPKMIIHNSEEYHHYIDFEVEIYTKLFREASKLIHRKEYFKQTLGYG